MNWKKFLLLIVLAVIICLPVLMPLLNAQYFHTHDFTHVARLAEMHQALLDGHFPVRWSRNLGFGYGLPQFNFYAPLTYYIAEVFHLIGFNELNSIKLLVTFNYLTSFMFIYVVASRLWGKYAGLIAATAFIYAPYRAVDTYVRGAFGELTAITMLSATIMCLVFWYFNKSLRWVGLSALAWGAIALSHNLIALIAFPVILMLLLVLIGIGKREARKQMSIQALMITVLMMGVSSFYTLPAFLEKQYTQVEKLTQDLSNFKLHFLYLRQFFIGDWGYGGSLAGLWDNISFQIGWVHVALMLLAGVAITYRWRESRKIDKTMVIYSIFVVLASMIMSSYKSQVIWELLSSILSFIQFPWRYLSIIIVFASLLAGASVLLFSTKEKWRKAFSITLVAVLMLANVAYFKPESYLENNEIEYYTDETRIRIEMSEVIPDFIPKIEASLPLTPPSARFELAQNGSKSDGEKSLNIYESKTHKFQIGVDSANTEELQINIFDFPGWEFRVNGVKMTQVTDKLSGTMKLKINPTGSEVMIEGLFKETPLRKSANLVTLISVVAIMYLIIFQDKHLIKMYAKHK